jgi:hypothetical protein
MPAPYHSWLATLRPAGGPIINTQDAKSVFSEESSFRRAQYLATTAHGRGHVPLMAYGRLSGAAVLAQLRTVYPPGLDILLERGLRLQEDQPPATRTPR